MPSPKEIAEKIKQVKKRSNLNKIIDGVVLADKFAKYAKEDEFLHGNKPDGSAIGRYKSLSYQQYKQRKNPLAGGDVDLINTSSFVDHMELKKTTGARKYLFKSTDSKSQMLQAKYGKDIMGLNEDTFSNITKNIYQDKIINEIKRQTGL